MRWGVVTTKKTEVGDSRIKDIFAFEYLITVSGVKKPPSEAQLGYKSVPHSTYFPAIPRGTSISRQEPTGGM